MARETILPVIINIKFPAARNFEVPAFESCMLARAKKRLTIAKKVKPLAENNGALFCDKIEVGDFFSTDQFVCKNPGHVPTGYGRESSDCCFQGIIIYNDVASSLIWVENQVCPGINVTVMVKSRLE